MTPSRQRPISPGRPWGCALVALAALLCARGALLARPEPPVREWDHQGGRQYLAFDAHGALVVGSGATLTWYDPTTGKPGQTIRADGTLSSFAISPDGQWLATGTTKGTLTLWTGAPDWRVAETMQLTPPEAQDTAIYSLVFSADGQTLGWIEYYATAGWMQTATARLWDRVKRQDRWTLSQSVQGEGALVGFGQLQISPDSQQIVLVGQALEVRRVDPDVLLYRVTRDPRQDSPFGQIAISPDQQWLASGGRGQVSIRRFSDGAVVHVLEGPKGYDHVVAFSPDSHYLAVGANTTSSSGLFIGVPAFPAWEPVTLWRVADWQPVQTFQGHVAGPYAIAYSRDGRVIATYRNATHDRTIRVWRVAPRSPFEPLAWIGGGLALLAGAFGRWIWRRRSPRP